MEQIILHLFGDYVLQPSVMAYHKSKMTWDGLFYCWMHSLIHGFLFGFFTGCSFEALMVIFWSHFIIDKFRLARFVTMLVNMKFDGYCGFPDSHPVWLSVWLLIVVDNTMHLACNFLALKYL